MISQTFIINSSVFKRKKLTILQHKLRVVMKCYTITNFILNEDNTYSFQKTFKKFGVKITDKNINTGSFLTSDVDELEILLKLNVN